MVRSALAILALLAPLSLCAGEAYTVHPIGSTDAPYGYLEHLPPDYKKTAKPRHPLVFFLHGLGELGDSNKELPRIANHGPLKHLGVNDQVGKFLDAHSAIVIAPQGLKSDGWWKNEKLIATLNFAIKQHPVDADRIYVTGLSMGGGGTWGVATGMPDTLAAIIPICGAAGPGDVTKLHGLPIWAHHAFGDGTVKFADNTQKWFDAILKDLKMAPEGGVMTGYTHNDKPWTGVLSAKGWQWQEGNALPAGSAAQPLNLTVWPDGSHDSWSRTYENIKVWEWLFSQSRGKKPLIKTESKH